LIGRFDLGLEQAPAEFRDASGVSPFEPLVLLSLLDDPFGLPTSLCNSTF
jgi:hypothetical protein